MRKPLKISVVIPALLVAFVLMHLASIQVTAGIYTGPQYVGYIWRFYSDYLGDVYSVVWSPDGSKLAAGGSGGTIVVLTADGKVVWGPKRVAYGSVLAITWFLDGSGIVVGTEYGYIVAFSADRGEVLWQIDLARQTTCGGPPVVSVAWISNRIIAVTTSDSCTVLIISPDGDILWIWSLGDYSDKIRQYGVYRASISPRGTEVALVSGYFSNYYITVFSLAQGRVIWENKQCFSTEVYGAQFCRSIYALAWSPDGSRITVGLDDGSIVTVNASDGRMLWRREGVFSPPSIKWYYWYLIDWSPDGSKMVIGGTVVSLISGEVLWRYSTSYYSVFYPSSVAWSPTGGAVVAGYYNYVYLFPVRNYTILYINAPYAKTRVIISDGVNTSSVVVNRGQWAKFYLDPGNYVLRFYLAEVPPNCTVLGSPAELVDLLAENPIEVALTTDAEVINITAPPAEDFLIGVLGKLVVRALPGTAIRFVWESGNSSYSVPQQGVLEVYLVPGVVYSVYVAPPQSGDYTFISNVTANAGEVLELNIQITSTQTTAITAVTTIPISATVTVAVTSTQSRTTTISQTSTALTKPATTTIGTTPTSAESATTATTTTAPSSAVSTTTTTPTSSVSRETPTQSPVIVATIPTYIFSDPYLVIVVAIVAIVAIVAVAVSRHREVIREKERERVERERVLQIAGGGGSAGGRRSSVVKEVEALVDKVKYMLGEGLKALESEWQTKCHILAEELSKLSASLAVLIAELEKRGSALDIADRMRDIRKFIDFVLNDYAQNGCKIDSEFRNSLKSLGRYIVELYGFLSKLESVLG